MFLKSLASIFLFTGSFLIGGIANKTIAQNLTQYVDPLIGSGGHGHVFVGANVPFGAVQIGPQNIPKGWDWCSGYHYSDSIMIGFSHMHLSGTGGSDLGDLLIMPYTGTIKTFEGTQKDHRSGYASLYTHEREKVQPGYYSVHLDDYSIDAELTASERVAFHKYKFPDGKQANIIFNLKNGIGDRATETFIEQVDDYTLKGYRMSTGWANDQRFYFAIKSDKPLGKLLVFNDTTKLTGTSGKGNAIKAIATFGTTVQTIQLKVGISPVSSDNALDNINAEIPDWNFDTVKKQADEKWNKELSKIEIETPTDSTKTIFYTSLYHTMFAPALFNDYNKDYRGTDKQVYKAAKFDNYTIFSLWDTYRALHPLYTIMQQDKVNDIISSMLAIYQQQKKLPVWHLVGCESNMMPGVSGVQVVAEAYLKGFKGFDTTLAMEAAKATMMTEGFGMSYDQKLQYIPYDKVEESVAKALEYGVSNGSVALMAKKMNRTEDFKYFHKRLQNYKLYYDSATGFFRGKSSSGTRNPVFNPVLFSHPWIDDLSEGNHWQYLWLVPQDVNGLIKLIGGENRFAKRLDSLFVIPAVEDPKAAADVAGLVGLYAHGDEPSHHIAYLYNYIGQQWKTAEKVSFLLKNMYQNQPNGLSGNEDCGQMSAWYILSSMGFYPVFPASGMYEIGSPLFDKTTINLPNGKQFTIKATNLNNENIYVQNITLNGKSYTKSYLKHQDIVDGGMLEFVMGNRPNYKFGMKKDDRPSSKY